MRFTRLEIPDCVRIDPRVFEDDRGFFLESWNAARFAEAGLDVQFKQDNHSRSIRGVLRGLHYQLRNPQGKLVRVVVGSIYDVMVDLRRGSPFFGEHVALELSAENRAMVYVPPGFAHGFYTMSAVAEVLYKTTDFYNAEAERTLIWNDPELRIAWPVPAGETPRLSRKDAAGFPLRDAEISQG
jgi:dTDP-4-dehydrorhamnose 3,5-epimerase